jgi:acyl-ACP thioesterase
MQPVTGRRFCAVRPVRLSDTTPAGRLRLDAVGRYLQDVASDDASDAGLGGATWVVRRLDLEVSSMPRLDDRVEMTTWCSGTGPRWAERRTTLVSRGALVEARALWVYVDPATGAPAPLPAVFHDRYGESAAGRRVRVRLEHPPPTPDLCPMPWTVRAVDLDVLDHVNNAVYWAVVEEALQRRGQSPEGHHFELEFRGGLVLGPAGVVESGDLDLWVLDAAGQVAASARVLPARH